MIGNWVVNSRTRLRFALFSCVLTLSHASSCAPAQADRSGEPATLRFHPDPIVVGVVGPGETRSLPLTISNLSAQLIEIEGVESSCECVLVEPTVAHVPPGSSVNLTVIASPDGISTFEGDLSVILSVRALGNRVVGQARVNMTVARQGP